MPVGVDRDIVFDLPPWLIRAEGVNLKDRLRGNEATEVTLPIVVPDTGETRVTFELHVPKFGPMIIRPVGEKMRALLFAAEFVTGGER